MLVVRWLAIVGLWLVIASPGAHAQQTLGLVAGNSWNLYGMHLSISSCTIGLNGAAATGCTAANKLELLQLDTGTNTITYEVIGYSGASPGTSISAALSSTNNLPSPALTSQLNITLVATSNGTLPNTKVTGATLTTVGSDAFIISSSGSSATASAAFSSGVTASTLLDTMSPETVGFGSATQQTKVAGPNGFSPSSIGFTIMESLLLNPNGQYVSSLSFGSATLKFTTTPEPASIFLLSLGLAGVGIARSRRNRNEATNLRG